MEDFEEMPIQQWPSGLSAGSATWMTPMSSEHMDWRGSWTMWMAYMVTSSSQRRYRKKSTFLFSTLTSIDHNLYQKPTHTHLYLNPESHHHLSSKQAILQGVKALCDWGQTPWGVGVQWHHFQARGYGQKQTWYALKPPMRTAKPTEEQTSLCCYGSRWLDKIDSGWTSPGHQNHLYQIQLYGLAHQGGKWVGDTSQQYEQRGWPDFQSVMDIFHSLPSRM